MLLATGSPLVAGSAALTMQTRYIRIDRAVYVGGVVYPVGAVIEVPRHVAASLINSNKASAIDKPAPVAEPVVVPDPAPEPKGKRHARK